MLLCNVLPNVTDTSHGAWRRLVSVQFPTLFKEQPDPKKPNERPVDFAIDGKIEAWADVFLVNAYVDARARGGQGDGPERAALGHAYDRRLPHGVGLLYRLL